MSAKVAAADPEGGDVEAPKQSMKEKYLGKAKDRYKLVEMLDSGFVVYSQSFLSDFILIFKEKHIIASIWMCHEESMFKRLDRFIVLILSLMFAFFFSFIVSLVEGDQGAVIALSIVATIAQTVYDMLAKSVTKCKCVQGCPSCIFSCCLWLGKCALAVQGCLGVILLILAVIMLLAEGNLVLGVTAFGSSKGSAFFFTSVATLVVTTYMKRRKQMKPDPEKMKDEAVRKGWYEPKKTKRCLCCCTCGLLGKSQKATCTAWNKWYGDHTEMTDLPVKAPDYNWDVKCGCNASWCCGCKRYTLYEHEGDYVKEDDIWTEDTPPGVDSTRKVAADAPADAAGAAPEPQEIVRPDAEPAAAAPAAAEPAATEPAVTAVEPVVTAAAPVAAPATDCDLPRVQFL
jgi:hypothetical protein